MMNDDISSSLAAVFRELEQRTEGLVELATALIQIPTIHPPGEHDTQCAEYIGERLKTRGFSVEYLRAAGCPGDSDTYPRTNVIGRCQGSQASACVHFNSHIDVVEVGSGWTVAPFAGVVREAHIWAQCV